MDFFFIWVYYIFNTTTQQKSKRERTMGKKHKWIRRVPLVLVSLLIVSAISVLFISQMNKTVDSHIMNTISEMAEHDRVAIENFIDLKWHELDNIYARFISYEPETVLGLQEQMNLETASSDFDTLYLIAEDGSVYTDRYMHYSREELDILKYFGPDDERIVKRHDYSTSIGLQKETLIYAVRLDDYEVEGTKFIALAGITRISQIQDRIMISSFTQNGVSRGYSSVINPNGDYIVNIKKTVSLNQDLNLYELLEKGSVGSEWSRESITDKMNGHETFSFYYTDEDGVEELLYFRPIEKTNWYFLSMIEKEVFTDYSRSFTLISIAMLIASLFIVIVTLLYLMSSHNRVLKANAEAKAKNEFLSNMSHEIRTPLNGVIGLLHLMQTHVGDNNKKQMSEWIEKAHATANYLLSLVSDILDMSKLQAGKLELAPIPFMVESMIDQIWCMQHKNIEEHGIEFIIEKNITIPCIIGDEIKIKQVLMNIIGNAAKFTPEGGTIRLSVSQEQTDERHVTTTIICEDTGIGMAPQFLETIWDSFTQEHNSKTSNIRGTGLGMAISKQFVDAMGGSISVKSEVNAGSTFTVVLPLEIARTLPVHSNEGSEDEDTDIASPRKRLTKLLVAEDNELNSDILKEILTDEGFDVVMAENGQVAVDRFAESKPGEFDAILMDIQMPVMDGYQATRLIRAMDREDAKTVPIFACTANTFKEDRDRALASGMNYFLIKPIDVNVLLMKLGKGKPNERKNKIEN